jgi:hypothetical protein
MGMKYLCLILFIISTANVAFAQASDPPSSSAGLEVVKFSWSKERIGWENDPFRGPIENFDEMRARARNERRITTAKSGGGDADRLRQDASADAANMATQHKTKQSHYIFTYKATVKNVSNKTIKSIDWDYVFYDKATEAEIGRQQFTNDENIAPGKSRELMVLIGKPPTQTISVTALNKDEANALTGRVVIVRVVYSDGSSWQIPSN